MSATARVGLVAAAIAALVLMLFVFNSYSPQVDNAEKDGRAVDEDMKKASSVAECESKAQAEAARVLIRSYGAVNGPSVLDAPTATGPGSQNLPTSAGIEEQTLDAVRQAKKAAEVLASGTYYLIACLRHLDAEGIIDFEESLKEVEARWGSFGT